MPDGVYISPTRRLTPAERTDKADPIIAKVREMIRDAATGDAELEFAIRRRVWNKIGQDERSLKVRIALKKLKRTKQDGKCTLCGGPLPAKGSVLDRLKTMDLYTEANTRLLCPDCDRRVQEERRYA
jgi:5-methylcytosine-specific restriction endonuclease McrA